MPISHVTGIACGNGFLSHGKYQGIAPHTHIISLKILDHLGQGNSSHAISAFRWILDNASKYNIKIVNLSIGTNDKKINRPLMNAVEQLWNRGLVVIAAGSNADGQKNFLPPPVLSPKILTVGAWEDRSYFHTPHRPFLFSEAPHTMPDIWTYGNDIVSVLSPQFDFSLQNRGTDKIVEEHYIRMSGTSMATPIISGLAALLLEKNPYLTPNQVKKALCHAAEKQDGLLTASSFLP